MCFGLYQAAQETAGSSFLQFPAPGSCCPPGPPRGRPGMKCRPLRPPRPAPLARRAGCSEGSGRA
eukprot:7060946-Alexandrium_andersonii.AAC.1